MNIFDATGTAYQDTSKLGQMLLTGKGINSVSKPNFYDLQSLVISAKEIELKRYSNGDVVDELIKESEAAIADKTSTQAKFDELLNMLQAAIDNLVHNDLSFDEKECRDIPKAYRTSDPESIRGSIVRVDYKTNTYDAEARDLDKYMLVYLPHGYDESDTTKKYDVLYLIHGNAESQHTAFGGVGQNTELMRVVDNLIADGKMKPMIIVTPTWYNTAPYSAERQSEDGLFRIKNFHNELVNDIIPTIEGKYNVYAQSLSEYDLKAARNHRAVGGFSMGSACTWYNYIYAIDYFKYYVPISLWCWQDVDSIKNEGYAFTGTDDEIKAKYLSEIAKRAGYTKDDIRIFCATGTADLAYGGMNSQIAEMKKLTDMFVYSADLRKGNFYYLTLEGGAHNWTCVNRYLYNILPDLFFDNK
ncbi:alpha/beta hydrolase [Ruminiclostridium josui]|uniref:alpha/beta hydrolase n=1 Tax=Ruminiclostridium josui TaxID=1499 RepID=UPI000B0747FF|nr:alpha/beta hydrolase-fold protein [Ruminiclostridium josui]